MWTDAVYGKDLDDIELKVLSAERGALRNLSSGIIWKRPDRTPVDAWYNATVGGNSDPKLQEILASGKAAPLQWRTSLRRREVLSQYLPTGLLLVGMPLFFPEWREGGCLCVTYRTSR